MIEYAKKEDIKELYAIWKDNFSFDDGGYTDYLFKYKFKPEETMIIREKNAIVSIASRRQHNYMINNTPVRGSLIYGVATIPQYRNRGLMKQIVGTMCDHAAYQELITFIQAYNPKVYENMGFSMMYYKTKYSLNITNSKIYPVDNCHSNVTPSEMLKIYATCMSKFDGYMIRDERYFAEYIQEIRTQKGLSLIHI